MHYCCWPWYVWILSGVRIQFPTVGARGSPTAEKFTPTPSENNIFVNKYRSGAESKRQQREMLQQKKALSTVYAGIIFREKDKKLIALFYLSHCFMFNKAYKISLSAAKISSSRKGRGIKETKVRFPSFRGKKCFGRALPPEKNAEYFRCLYSAKHLRTSISA